MKKTQHDEAKPPILWKRRLQKRLKRVDRPCEGRWHANG